MTDTFDVTKERDLYSNWRPFWAMFADFNEFGPDILRSGKYLHKHPREEQPAYLKRCKRADNYNLIPEIIQCYRGYQFSKAPTRDFEGKYAKIIEAFLNNCDGGGMAIDDFMQHYAYVDALVYGWTELFVDMPQMAVKPTTTEQATDLGLVPYVRSITPLLRTNWSTDDKGNYNWAVLYEPGQESEEPATDPVGDNTYLVLKKNGWERYAKQDNDMGKKAFTLKDNGDYAIGRVPLIPLYNERSRKFKRFGVSLINEAAPIAQAILNLISQQEQDVFASFSFIAIQTDSKLDNVSELGTQKIVTYALEAKNPPMYIVVPVDHIKVKQEIIEKKVEHMLRKAKLSVAMGELSTKTKSGIAGEVERMELFTYLGAMARHLEAAERRMISLVCSWQAGQYVSPEDTKYNVHYNDEFTLEAIPELITLAEKISNIYKTVSPTYVKQVLKRLPHRDMPTGDKERDVIDKEIDNADIEGMDLIPESQVEQDGDIK